MEELTAEELAEVIGGCECHGTVVINSCNQEIHNPPPPLPPGAST